MRKVLGFVVLAVLALIIITLSLGKGSTPTKATSNEDAETAKPTSASKAERTFAAERIEEGFLEQGLDVHVSAKGKDGKTLTIRWILIGRPFVYNFTNNYIMMKRIRERGFTKIHFDNGRQWWDEGV